MDTKLTRVAILIAYILGYGFATYAFIFLFLVINDPANEGVATVARIGFASLIALAFPRILKWVITKG